MPEMPDLEVIAEVLQRKLGGATILGAEVLKPIVVRNLTGESLPQCLAGQGLCRVSRRGKFLLLALDSGDWLVVNPMRSGRLRLLTEDESVHGKPHFALRFMDGSALQYSDADRMGKIYVTRDLDMVPTFASLGPEALSPGVTLPVFTERLSSRRGEIKGVLTNQTFVAGIGSAYADEILYRAGIYPFRKSPSLGKDEIGRLHQAMVAVLQDAVDTLRVRVGEAIHLEIRDFLQVHGRGGEPCLRCGSKISTVSARGRITNFCRNCQPGRMT
jgi:formamidopyrimidine-DNA glycosylase